MITLVKHPKSTALGKKKCNPEPQSFEKPKRTFSTKKGLSDTKRSVVHARLSALRLNLPNFAYCLFVFFLVSA